MGNLLGSPVTEKETFSGKTSEGVEYGISSMQGWRIHYEDEHICLPELYAEETIESEGTKVNRIALDGTSLFAVFDGHGGKFSAEFCASTLVSVLSRNNKMIQYAKEIKNCSDTDHKKQRELAELLGDAIQQTFLDLDMELLRVAFDGGKSRNNQSNDVHADEERSNENVNAVENIDESGTTAIVVILTPKFIISANAGDSRAIYKTSNMTIPLSFDHKPDDELEETRIRRSGGYVSGGRVDGDLAVSRGLGDFRFKTSPQLRLEDQKVSPLPDIIIKPRNPANDKFILLACDGIWDVVTNQECTRIVTDIFAEGETNMGLVCEELLDICLRLGSKDNMTALIVKLPALEIGKGGGVEARRQRLSESQNNVADDTQNQPESEQTYELEF